MDPLRSHFSLEPELIYLNSGTLSLTPRPVLEALRRHQIEYERNPTEALFGTWARLWKAQLGLGTFFHADPSALFLRSNVSAAMNEFIQGIPLAERGEIVVTDLEYGAIVNAAKSRAQKDGLSLRVIPVPADLSQAHEDDLVKALVDPLRAETRLLIVSHVMTGNGLVVPLEKLARETRRRGILLAVDGAHGPGAVDLDFRRLGDVDFYGGNLHKWMMGPKGTAFGWVSPRHHESLEPRLPGWTTFETHAPFDRYGGGRFAAKFLLSACHDFAPFFSLEEMIRFWRETGPDRIRSRLRELQDAFDREMIQSGLSWKLLSPPAGPLRGPLLTYQLPDRLSQRGLALMDDIRRDHGLQVATPPIRGRCELRVSPHIHNTEDEIVRAVRILRSL